jgi:hypothetical protein
MQKETIQSFLFQQFIRSASRDVPHSGRSVMGMLNPARFQRLAHATKHHAARSQITSQNDATKATWHDFVLKKNQ